MSNLLVCFFIHTLEYPLSLDLIKIRIRFGFLVHARGKNSIRIDFMRIENE